MKRIGVAVILALAFFGIADSAYLAQSEASDTPLICDIEKLSGCNIVAASEYSQIFGVSIAQYGVLFYVIVFVLAALELVLFDRILRRVLQGVAFVGIVASGYFIFVQVFFINAVCVYCIVSAVLAFLIFVCATLLEPLRVGATINAKSLHEGSMDTDVAHTEETEVLKKKEREEGLHMPPSP